MRLSSILAPLALLLSTASAACKCSGVTNPGLYCGYCLQVTEGWQDKLNHAFSCAKSGGCVDHGKSTPCQPPNVRDAYHCGGRDKWRREAEAEADVKFVEIREAEGGMKKVVRSE